MENLAQYLAAVLGKEEKMWVLFLSSFILVLVLCYINAALHEHVWELEASISSMYLADGRRREYIEHPH